MVDNLVLLDRPEYGKNSKEKRSEPTGGAVEVERSKLKISSGLWPKHAVKEDLSSERMRPSFTRRPSLVTGLCGKQPVSDAIGGRRDYRRRGEVLFQHRSSTSTHPCRRHLFHDHGRLCVDKSVKEETREL